MRYRSGSSEIVFWESKSNNMMILYSKTLQGKFYSLRCSICYVYCMYILNKIFLERDVLECVVQIDRIGRIYVPIGESKFEWQDSILFQISSLNDARFLTSFLLAISELGQLMEENDQII